MHKVVGKSKYQVSLVLHLNHPRGGGYCTNMHLFDVSLIFVASLKEP